MMIKDYERIHVLPTCRNLREIARFLVMSLLISNGIRRNTLSIVRVGSRWIVAPGDKIRHLRPDADTSEGWIKAVLRGKNLGAVVIPEIEYLGVGIALLHSSTGAPGEILEIGDTEHRIFCYVEDLDSIEKCPLSTVEKRIVPKWGFWRTASLVNTILDRVDFGLPPC